MEYKTGDKVLAEVTIQKVDYEADTGSIIYYADGWVPASKVITDRKEEEMSSENSIPAAAPTITIPKSEYDSYIALAARIDTIKDYIVNDEYAKIDTVSVMLGIKKTS